MADVEEQQDLDTMWCRPCKDFYTGGDICPTCKTKGQTRTDAIATTLRNPKLLEEINYELGVKIEGELETRKAIFLFGCIRLVTNRGKGTSNVLLINAKSSVGKDYVSRAVCEMHPAAKVEHLVKVSSAAFTYYKANEEGFTWDGRICRLSDIGESLLKSDVFKTFLTDEGKSVVTNKSAKGTTGAFEYLVKGKPIIIATTANAEPSEELLNRVNLLSLDETQEQTKAINKRQLKNAEQGFDDESNYSRLLLMVVEKLEPVRIIIPYAMLLEPHLPKDLRSRRDTPRILNLIKASAALHQHSRERDDKGNILANADDYENARAALKVIQTGFYVSLTRTARDIWSAAQTLYDKENKPFSAKQLHNFSPVCSLKSVYDHLDKLAQRGLLIGSEESREDSNKPVQVYKPAANDVQSLVFPPFNELGQITNASISSKTSNASKGSITPLTAGAIEAIEPIEGKKGMQPVETGAGRGLPDSTSASPAHPGDNGEEGKKSGILSADTQDADFCPLTSPASPAFLLSYTPSKPRFSNQMNKRE